MPDLSQLSNEELMAIAGPPSSSGSDLSSLSNEELMKMAGPPSAPAAVTPSSLGDTFIQSIENAPSDLWNSVKAIPSGVANIWNSVTSPSESINNGTTENTVRGTGKLASALAGGSLGAEVGLPAAPFTFGIAPLVTGAIGAGAGLLGFDKLNQATGSDAPTTPQQDLNALTYNTGTGIATAGLAKAAGAIAAPILSAPGAIADTAEGTAGTLVKNAVGLSRSARAKALTAKGGAKWIDEQGAEVEPKDAVELRTRIDKNLGIIDEDIGLKSLPNDPTSIKQVFDQRLVDTGKELSSKVDAADAALEAQNAPTKAAVTPEVSRGWWPSLDEYVNGEKAAAAPMVPTSSPVEIAPNWSLAEDFIKNGKGTAGEGANLQKALDKVKEDWDNSPKTFADLVKFKERVNDGSIFKDNLSLSEKARISLRRQIYYGVQKAAEQAYDKLVPEDAGGFAATNQKYSAYKSFSTPLANRIEGVAQNTLTGLANEGVTDAVIGGLLTHGHPVLGGLAGVYHLAAKLRPVSTANLLSAAATPLSIFGNATSGISSLFGSVPTSAVQAVSEGSNDVLARSDSPNVLSRVDNVPALRPTPQQNRTSLRSPNGSDRGINRSDAQEPASQVDAAFNALKQSGAPITKAKLEKVIDADPYASAVYETESDRGRKVTTKESSAKGPFQFINATAKSVGLKDPFDLGQSLEAFNKLTKENADRFGTDDPYILYSAHFLGAPLLEKVLTGDALSKKERELVASLQTSALPRFEKIYAAKVGTV